MGGGSRPSVNHANFFYVLPSRLIVPFAAYSVNVWMFEIKEGKKSVYFITFREDNSILSQILSLKVWSNKKIIFDENLTLFLA